MRLSDRTRTALYEAIHGPVMDARVEVALADGGTKENPGDKIDRRIARLPDAIYRRVLVALNAKEHPDAA